jgi:hypothetical protein
VLQRGDANEDGAIDEEEAKQMAEQLQRRARPSRNARPGAPEGSADEPAEPPGSPAER